MELLVLMPPRGALSFFVAIALLLLSNMPCEAKLSTTFYEETCPGALGQIRSVVRSAVSVERRMAASLLRLHFHDCFVQVGGPSWKVKLGRRDSKTASESRAESNLPRFSNSLDELISLFDRKGLSQKDMVALSGAHTIGQAQCATFRDRIYDAENINEDFASTHRRRCPERGGNRNLAALDLVTPNSFDNNYFKNLIERKGLLASDQVLFNGGSTDELVTKYSNSRSTFTSDFASAMVKMGDISPLTGKKGEIRRFCNVPN